jgi:putative endonuclease
MLVCTSSVKKRTYVGYTNNLKNRLKNHNSNKGAKYTKGNKWKIIYKRKFLSKKKAMSYEYILKHDRKERLKIFNNYK